MQRTQAISRQQSLFPQPKPPTKRQVRTTEAAVKFGRKALALGTWGLAALEKAKP
jgi:hypothetical protein